MLKPGEDLVIYSQWDELPDPIRARTDPAVAQHLGKPVSVMFPEFATAFPRAVAELEAKWAVPRMSAFKVTDCLVKIACEQADRNVIFDATMGYMKLYEKSYYTDELLQLPVRWRELYRHFDSFSLRLDSEGAFLTGGMPCGFSKRVSIPRAIGFGMPRPAAKAFAKSVGSNPLWLNCWLLTNAGDSLWIDEQKCDQRVWHCHRDTPEDHVEIADPGETLDRYLAWRFAGGEASGFDFRKGAPR